MKLRVIITGATGMVGEGVLHECLNHPEVEQVLVLNRRPCNISHDKLKEVLHDNFFDISSIESQLMNYNACFFCLGTTAVGKTEAEYTRLTYTLTINFASTIAALNPGMTFCYISGAGTDSTGQGRTMWARVKGKTENDLVRLPFRQVYNFRPGGIQPFLPLKPSQTYYKTYKYLGWLFSLMKIIAPNYVITLKDLAAAMINASLTGYPKNIVEMKEMKILAKTDLKK
jgi:uncharacterized protein YbjT (DUF2867 family)